MEIQPNSITQRPQKELQATEKTFCCSLRGSVPVCEASYDACTSPSAESGSRTPGPRVSRLCPLRLTRARTPGRLHGTRTDLAQPRRGAAGRVAVGVHAAPRWAGALHGEVDGDAPRAGRRGRAGAGVGCATRSPSSARRWRGRGSRATCSTWLWWSPASARWRRAGSARPACASSCPAPRAATAWRWAPGWTSGATPCAPRTPRAPPARPPRAARRVARGRRGVQLRLRVVRRALRLHGGGTGGRRAALLAHPALPAAGDARLRTQAPGRRAHRPEAGGVRLRRVVGDAPLA